MRHITLVMISAAILAGCATSYQPMGWNGGYEETRLDKNVFLVSFRGNQHTSMQQAQDFAFLRAADLALESGYQYLAIVQSDKSLAPSSSITPTWSPHSAIDYYVSYAYMNSRASSTGGATDDVSKPSITMTIICFKESPETLATVLDASFMAESIRRKYGIK
jgi:hypothetical protein